MANSALLSKNILVTPLPFKEEAHAAVNYAIRTPGAPAVATFSAASTAANDFTQLQKEAAALKAKTGLDWAVGNAVCEACGNTFGAVAPVGAGMFDCPKCKTHRARWKYAFVKPGRHWSCVCGNLLFRASEQGWYCPQCGVDQTLPGFVK